MKSSSPMQPIKSSAKSVSVSVNQSLPTMPKRLINATNLRHGGGPAVATSFIYDLSLWPQEAEKYAILVSDYIDTNLRALGCSLDAFGEYRVLNYYGLNGLRGGLTAELRKYDIVFTVFGPCYGLGYRGLHLVGFADPWIAYPKNEVYARLSWPQYLRAKLEWFVRGLFFLNSSLLVCELEHVPLALKRNTVLASRSTEVIHSAIPSIYAVPQMWGRVDIPRREGVLNIGLISRNYPHKNLGILPAIKRVLEQTYDLRVEVYVTFSGDEWQGCSEEYRATVQNVGPLKLNQCPAFYMAMDVVVFPSLLECFSAVPIEALYMRKPLVASDRGFVRDCCEEYGFYFNPTNSEDAAKSVIQALDRTSTEPDFLENAYQHVQKFGSSQRRSKRYLSLIEEYAHGVE